MDTFPDSRPAPVLLADDDPDDRLMASEAFAEAKLLNPLIMVNDGLELLNALRGEGQFAGNPLRPTLVLLDLNMPRIDGRDALRIMKTDPTLAGIPVVVMTTSRAEEDMLRSTDMGAAAFITKPVTFPGLVDVMRELPSYWMEIVEVAGEP
jgi:CheY-like chemotaxis protein